MELLGPDLRSWQLCFGSPGLPRPAVKQVLTQVKKKKYAEMVKHSLLSSDLEVL